MSFGSDIIIPNTDNWDSINFEAYLKLDLSGPDNAHIIRKLEGNEMIFGCTALNWFKYLKAFKVDDKQLSIMMLLNAREKKIWSLGGLEHFQKN